MEYGGYKWVVGIYDNGFTPLGWVAMEGYEKQIIPNTGSKRLCADITYLFFCNLMRQYDMVYQMG